MRHRPSRNPRPAPSALSLPSLALLLVLLPACVGSPPRGGASDPAPDCEARGSGEVCWAFSETFDGRPDAPSQALLPRTLDYAATHRSHPAEHFRDFGPFPADHGADCAPPEAQHPVTSRHQSGGGDPDASFYLCADHMMSSLGDVEGYSVSAFWPRQEFDFAGGGVLEFDVNLNDRHPRHWFEVMIAPADQLKIGAAAAYLPIDETYPRERIVLAWGLLGGDSSRAIRVGAGALDPVLFGQLHNPMRGQVLLSVNGRAPIAVEPHDYADGDCHASGWSSFRLPLDPAWLIAGENRLHWSIGPRPDCVADWVWDGFSVKHLRIQLSLE